jgi:hypothetical protein
VQACYNAALGKVVAFLRSVICLMLVDQYRNKYVRTIDNIPIDTKPMPA